MLGGDFDFKGAFSFSKAYPDAPNPALQLSDTGVVGLPLNSREAEIIKSQCALAPFGQGERTLVDKTVRDTWETPANKVSSWLVVPCKFIAHGECLYKVTFGSPHWDSFLARVVKDVCHALGVNFEASAPRCELYKMLLYETGSQ